MMWSWILFGVFTLFVLQIEANPSHGKVVVCNVFTKLAIDLMGSDFRIEDAALDQCTHLQVIDRSWFWSRDPWDDVTDQDESDYQQLNDLRTKFPHLKINLAIHHSAAQYMFLASEPKLLERFIKRASRFLSRYNFDGLDFNWDYQQLDRIKPNDIHKIVSFVKTIKENLPSALLTASFVVSNEVRDGVYDYAALSKHLDFICFMQTYITERRDTLQMAVNQRSIGNLKETLVQLIQLGVPSEKLVMGIHFGGPQFDSYSIFQKMVGYDEICALKGQRCYNETASLSTLTQNEGEWLQILFESKQSISERMKLVVELGLAGVLTNPIHLDDFNGICDNNHDTFNKEQKFPLLHTINDAINLAGGN